MTRLRFLLPLLFVGATAACLLPETIHPPDDDDTEHDADDDDSAEETA